MVPSSTNWIYLSVITSPSTAPASVSGALEMSAGTYNKFVSNSS